MFELNKVYGYGGRHVLGFLRIVLTLSLIPIIYNSTNAVIDDPILYGIAFTLGAGAAFSSLANGYVEMVNKCNTALSAIGLVFMLCIFLGVIPAMYLAPEIYTYGSTITDAQFMRAILWLLGGIVLDIWDIEISQRMRNL
ncbi:MAG: hypothetical protein ACOZAO_01455 [Patescibacteria group bacterium]